MRISGFRLALLLLVGLLGGGSNLGVGFANAQVHNLTSSDWRNRHYDETRHWIVEATINVTLELAFQTEGRAGVRLVFSRAASGFDAAALLVMENANLHRVAPDQPYLSWDVEINFLGYDVSVQLPGGVVFDALNRTNFPSNVLKVCCNGGPLAARSKTVTCNTIKLRIICSDRRLLPSFPRRTPATQITVPVKHIIPAGITIGGTLVPWNGHICLTPLEMFNFSLPLDQCSIEICAEGGCLDDRCRYAKFTWYYEEMNNNTFDVSRSANYTNVLLYDGNVIHAERYVP
eukprot:506700-Prorocentrum_minimum.AAC.2